MKTNFKFIFLSFFISNFLFAQTTKKGWEQMANNDFENAQKSFNQAIKSNDNPADAYLALSLLSAIEGKEKKSIYDNYFNFFKNSTNPSPTLELFWNISDVDQAGEYLNDYENLSKIGNPYLFANVNFLLGQYFFSKNDFEKSKNYFDKINPIRQWQIVGNFDNISNSGFNKNYDPISHPESNAKFVNRSGAEINWLKVNDVNYNGWFNLGSHYYTEDSVIFAQTFCNSTTEQEVQLRIGLIGSIKVWVNDKLAYEQIEERNTTIDHYVINTKLNKGYNRILVQLGADYNESIAIYSRFTDKNGNPLNLNFSNNYQNYTKENTFVSTLEKNKSEEYYLQKIKDEPDYFLNYLVLLQNYILNKRLEDAKQLIQKVEELFPNSFLFYNEKILLNMYSGNSSGRSEFEEKLKRDFPDSYSSLNMNYNEQIENENIDEAIKYFEKLEKLNINEKEILKMKIQIAAKKNEVESMIRLIESAYEKFPNESNFVTYKFIIEKNVKQNKKSALKILENYLEKNHDEEMVDVLFDEYIENSDDKKAISLMESYLLINPNFSSNIKRIADFYYQKRKYDVALTYYQKILDIAPTVGNFHQYMAKAYKENNQKQEAIKSYKNAIYYSPTLYDARETLRQLEGKPDVFLSFEQLDVYDIFKKSPNAKDFPDDNSIFLLDETQKVVYPEGGSEEKYITLIKILNTSGIERWKEYSIGVYYNQDYIIEKAEVLKKNGSVVKATTNGTDIVFPNLEVGDAIHITHKIKNYYSGQLAKHIWEEHYFQYFIPIKKSKFSLLLPENKTLNYVFANGDLKPSIEKVNDFNKYVWETNDVKSAKSENLMPELIDVGPVLHLSTIEDWNVINSWYSDISDSKANVTFEVRNLVNELFKNKNNLTNEQKVKIIYDYVANEIQYVSVPFLQSGIIPQRASDVINTKQGDCKDVSTLFVAMCNAIGIDADLMLVNTNDNGFKSMIVPNNMFNHCIATIVLDSKVHYVELTDPNLPFASRTNSLDNAQVLQINRNKKTSIESLNFKPEVENKIERNSTINFDNNNAVINVKTIKFGEPASGFRSTYENIGDDERRKNLQDAISNGSKDNNKLLDVKFIDGLEDNSGSVKYEYTYSQIKPFNEVAGMNIYTIPFSEANSNLSFINSEDRTYPISILKYFGYFVENERFEINIPSQQTIVELPKDIIIKDEHFILNITFEKKANTLIVSRKFELLKMIVDPKNYKVFKSNIELMIKADNSQIAFKKI